MVFIYRADKEGRVLERYNPDKKRWEKKSDFPFACPRSFGPTISPQESIDAISYFLQSGVFKMVTEYIIVGDEPKGQAVADLKNQLPQNDYNSMRDLLKMMPRNYLRGWFMKEVWPTLEGAPLPFKDNEDSRVARMYEEVKGGKKKDEDLIWGAIIDLFNQANLDYVNQFKIMPWAWEEEKMKSFLVSQSKDGLEELQEKFDNFKKEVLGEDPVAQQLIAEYNSLPKSGDPGLEISRQFAIAELLKKKEYSAVRGIIDAYKYAAESAFGDAVERPVPFTVTAGGKEISPTN